MHRLCVCVRRQDRIILSDGRRCNRWWLVDQHNQEHLAVVGTERETRDAHYTYHAVSAPLQAAAMRPTPQRHARHLPPAHADSPSALSRPACLPSCRPSLVSQRWCLIPAFSQHIVAAR